MNAVSNASTVYEGILSDYLAELSWLHYDLQGIASDYPEHSEYWYNKVSPRGHTERFYRYPAKLIECHPGIQDIMSQVRARLPDGFTMDVGMTKFPPYFDLAPHLDYYRQAGIMFPLSTEDLAPIRWVNDCDELLCEHYYRMPTLIRTQIRHGVTNRSATRVNLELTFRQPWEEILTYLAPNREVGV